MADNKNFCPECGYTQEDAQIHFDHYLCKNKNPPWSESGEPSQDDKPADDLQNAIMYIEHGFLTLRTQTGLLLWDGRVERLENGVYLHEILDQ